MQQLKRHHKKQTKRILIIASTIVILLATVAVVLFFTPIGGLVFNKTTKQTPQNTETTTYSDPSETDIKESQNAKKKADSEANSPSNTNPSSSSKKKVAVAVSYADIYNNNLEVRAFISSVIEGTGTCTVTATMGSQKVTESATAFIDASTTQCNPIYIAESRLSSGIWSVVTTFSSPDAEGSSDAIEVNVP